MGKKKTYFNDAVALRMKGHTLQEIKDITGVSENSLSKWFLSEGVDDLKKMVESSPLGNLQKLDEAITALINQIYQPGEPIDPTKTDGLSKLLKARRDMAGPGSEDFKQAVLLVSSELVRHANEYFDNDEDRKKLAGLLQSFFKRIKEK